MASDDPTDTGTVAGIPGIMGNDNSRYLLRRRFKVTMCDADPRFVSKVARIQDEVLSGTGIRNLPGPVIVPQNEAQCLVEQEENLGLIEKDGDFENENLDLGISERPNIPNIVADGPCLSRPSKKKVKPEKTTKKTATKTGQIDVPLATSPDTQDGVPDIDQMEDSRPQIYDQDEEEKIPVPPFEDVDSGVSTCYSSEETIPAEESYKDEGEKMEINDDVVDSQDVVESRTNAPSGSISSVSDKIDLLKYSQSEWKGGTHTAEYMRLGYSKIMQETACSGVRTIRGDNYCALRATCFQILSQNLNILRSWNAIEDIVNVPQKLLQNYGFNWLTQWTFAGRLKVMPKKKIETMKQCLHSFCEALQISRSIEQPEDRLQYFLQYFNSGQSDEVLLFEAVKLLMLHSAVLLHADIMEKKEVPVFAWLLFARDTSETPESLMKNHLNAVGDSGGLEQVEMFLLGYALNLTIRVARPSKVNQQEFMTFYPEDRCEEWDMCNLIAEDDRHYNIIVP